MDGKRAIRRGTLRPPLVLVAAYLLLTAAAYLGGDKYLAPWLPVLRLESEWLLPDGFVAAGIRLTADNKERLIALRVESRPPVTFAGHDLPRLAIETTTLQAYALHHAVIVLAVLAAYPVTRWRRRLRLLALGVPCVFLTTSLDIPFVLAGLAREALLTSLAPERLGSDPFVLYYKFMHGGGRLGLAIAGALLVIAAAQRRGARDARSERVVPAAEPLPKAAPPGA